MKHHKCALKSQNGLVSINTSVTTATVNARANNFATIVDAKAVLHLLVKDK